MSYSVVILSKNEANLKACLGAVVKNEPRASVIVVDDFDEPLADIVIRDPPGPGPRLTWVKGRKPFVFARNANIGIQAAGCELATGVKDDVILLNDDALLMTPNGFDSMADAARSAEGLKYGVISALIVGGAAAPDQIAPAENKSLREHHPVEPWRCNHHMLAFICVYIRRQVLDQLGPLDERYVDYGYDDDDYCLRIRRAGLELGVCGTLVEHGSLVSTYRGRGVATTSLQPNFERFVAKWGAAPFQLAKATAEELARRPVR